MDIAKHIQQLLYTNDSVVVPDLGVFLTKYLPSSIDERNNIIEPPRKTLKFEGNDRVEDDLLVEHIAAQETISTLHARDEVERFVRELKNEVKANNQAELEGIGTFIMDSNRQLGFSASPTANFNKDTFGLTPTELPEKQTTTESTEPQEQIFTLADLKRQRAAQKASQGEPKETVTSVLKANTQKEKTGVDYDTEQRTPVKPPPFKIPKRRRSWGRSLLWILPILAILLLGLLGAQLLMKNSDREIPIISSIFGKDKKETPANNAVLPNTELNTEPITESADDEFVLVYDNTTQTRVRKKRSELTPEELKQLDEPQTTNNENTNNQNDSNNSTQTIADTEVKETPPPTNDNTNQTNTNSTNISDNAPRGFHIVVGVFQDLANAQNLASNLKGGGFDTFIIKDNVGKYRATVFGTDNKNNALQTLNRVRQSQKPDAWMYFKQ